MHQILWRQLEYIDAHEKLSFDVILVFCVDNYLKEILFLDTYNKQAFGILGFEMCCVHKKSEFIFAIIVTNNLRIFAFYITWFTNFLDKIV